MIWFSFLQPPDNQPECSAGPTLFSWQLLLPESLRRISHRPVQLLRTLPTARDREFAGGVGGWRALVPTSPSVGWVVVTLESPPRVGCCKLCTWHLAYGCISYAAYMHKVCECNVWEFCICLKAQKYMVVAPYPIRRFLHNHVTSCCERVPLTSQLLTQMNASHWGWGRRIGPRSKWK